MKQKRLISIFLTLALVATTMFAGAEAVFANSTETAYKLTSGNVYSYTGTANDVVYYKIYSPSNGYLEVQLASSNGSNFYMGVLNYKKKNLYSNREYIDNGVRYVGVGKGTYYLAISTNDTYYGIKVTHHAVKENSGSKKSTAKKLSKGYTKKGVITAGQSTTSGDWYKFTIKSKQYVKLKIATLTSTGGNYGGVKVTIRPANSSSSVVEKFKTDNPSYTVSLYTFGYNNRLAPGTYYIKVQKYNKGNGYYQIKWQ